MAKNPKQSTRHLTAMAAEMMNMAKEGGPIQAHVQELRCVLRCVGPAVTDEPIDRQIERENETADTLLAAIEFVLKPYFDDAESLAASVLSQAASK